ncbi:MAG TPA: cytochrome P450 [Acidimicrobiales bacterium]|nr:cytochrome P450 [Acidimicrobiales bacterium]
MTTLDPKDVGLFHDPAQWEDMVAWHDRVAALRREHRAVWIDEPDYAPYLVLLRHGDIFEVERNHDVWHNTTRVTLAPDAFFEQIEGMGIPEPKALVQLDGHDHRVHRQVANDWFKPAATQRWQARIDEIADEFVQRMQDLGGSCDFAVDIAQPYTLRVIMEIYGVPPEDEPLMLELTQGVFGSSDPEFASGGDDMLMSAAASVFTFIQYFNQVTEDRRANPRDDLASVIANGEVEGRLMDDEHRLWYYIIVATAGHDTTSFALAGGLQALLENPEQLDALRQQPELVVNAAEECIRWTSPVRHMMRYADIDTEVAGHAVPAGSRVLLCYPSANRDETVFERPMEFDVTRPDVANLISFGLGPHFCLGAHFARRELRTMLGKLATQLDSIELAGTPESSRAHFVSGTKHLPIAYRFR